MSTTARHRSTQDTGQAGRRAARADRRKRPGSRFAAKILATVALVVAAGTVAGVGTFGAYTDTTTADTAVSSGVVDVRMNGGSQGVHVDAAKMVPGDAVQIPITISRGPDSVDLGDLAVSTVISNRNRLTDNLILSVGRCSQAWTSANDHLTCGGIYTPIYIGSNGVELGSTDTWLTSDWTDILNSGRSLYLRATLTLNPLAPQETSGMATGITWKVSGTQRTSKTSVATPAAS